MAVLASISYLSRTIRSCGTRLHSPVHVDQTTKRHSEFGHNGWDALLPHDSHRNGQSGGRTGGTPSGNPSRRSAQPVTVRVHPRNGVEDDREDNEQVNSETREGGTDENTEILADTGEVKTHDVTQDKREDGDGRQLDQESYDDSDDSVDFLDESEQRGARGRTDDETTDDDGYDQDGQEIVSSKRVDNVICDETVEYGLRKGISSFLS